MWTSTKQRRAARRRELAVQTAPTTTLRAVPGDFPPALTARRPTHRPGPTPARQTCDRCGLRRKGVVAVGPWGHACPTCYRILREQASRNA